MSISGPDLTWIIIIGSGVVVTFVVFYVVAALTSQRRLINIQREKIRESERAEGLLRQLPEKIIEGEEKERTRLSRELHDGINQMLASINYRLHTAKAKYSGDANLKEHLDGLLVDLGTAMEEVRRMSHNLHPKVLDQLGLNTAVQNLCTEFTVRTGIPIGQSLAPLPPNLSKDIQLGLFRIIQEALTNIQKHARASEVSIRSECADTYLEIAIADNGKGLDSANRDGGLGLTTICERAILLKGQATIEPNGTNGTRVVVRVRLAEPSAH